MSLLATVCECYPALIPENFIMAGESMKNLKQIESTKALAINFILGLEVLLWAAKPMKA